MKMNTSRKGIAVIVVIVIFLMGLQVSCALRSAGLPDSRSQPEPDPNRQQAQSQNSDDTQAAAAAAYLDCPQPGELLYLGFDHALTINHEGANLTHILQSGILNLSVQAATDQGEVAITSIAPTPLTYEMQGIIKDCSLEMLGSMQAFASGYCEDGTVYLIITEDWQPASGQMICPDGAIPFQVPAAGAMLHEGADGNGEVFYLVEGSQGYSSMRPFQEGDGYHTWTLYTSQIDNVPLVPENE